MVSNVGILSTKVISRTYPNLHSGNTSILTERRYIIISKQIKNPNPSVNAERRALSSWQICTYTVTTLGEVTCNQRGFAMNILGTKAFEITEGI